MPELGTMPSREVAGPGVDPHDERLSVVMPVFNESAVIERVVTEVMTEVANRLPGTEVIVVDDCSTDETPLLLEDLTSRYAALRVVRAPTNRGHGPSVAAGLDVASHDWVFLMDSDAQFLVRDFWRLWEVRDGADLVMGNRDKRVDPRHRLILSRLVKALVSRLALRPLADPNVPFKLLRRRLWLDLREHVARDALTPSMMIALGAALWDRRIISVTVAHLPRAHGRSKMRAGRLVRFGFVGLMELVAFRKRVVRTPPVDKSSQGPRTRSNTTA